MADRAVEAAFEDAAPEVRAGLARLLRDGGRAALAERLVPWLRRAYGERDAAAVLAGCGPEFVRRMLPELAGAVPFEGWGRLGVRHPLAVIEYAEAELRRLPVREQDWWKRHALGLAAAMPADPARVLGLIERWGPCTLPGPVTERLDLLVAVDAERVARWLCQEERGTARWERTPGRRALRGLALAAPPSLPALGARWLPREAFRSLLAATPPGRRLALAEEATALFPYGTRELPDGVLPLLPVEQRYAEAEARIAACRAEGGADMRWRIWQALVLLPPERARPELLAALPGSDAEDREAIWCFLVDNAGPAADPAALAELVALAAGRLRSDRDAVRREFLDSLGNLEPDLLAAAVAEDPDGSLEGLCGDALRAADCTAWTRDTLRDLALGLLAHTWSPAPPRAEASAGVRGTAARILEALAAHTGTADLGGPGRLDGPPRNGLGVVVLDALRPWLDRARARDDLGPLLAAADAFGARGHRVPALQERLAHALLLCPAADFGRLAGPWLADPATRGARVARLLEQDPSAAVTAPVLAVLATDRTDLLDLALGEAVPPGRFPAPGASRALPGLRHAARWLPRQQRAAVRLVGAAVADADRPLDERAALLRAVGPVPVHGAALAARYLPPPRTPEAPEAPDAADAPVAPHPVLVRAALEASGRADDPAAALATLLALAGADGAGTVWAAAGRVANRTRPGLLAPVLEEVLTREHGVKVTVRKTAARLTARHLPPRRAVPLLTAVARDPRTHVDVRVVVTGLATGLLGTPGAWELLEDTVTDGPPAARLILARRSPPDLAAAHRARYGMLLARLAEVDDEEVAGEALGALPEWAAHAPGAVAVLSERCTDLTSSEKAMRTAFYRLRDLLGSGLPHPLGGAEPGSLLHGVVTRLVAAVAAGERGGAAPHEGGDLPARRRLEQLADGLYGAPGLYAPLARLLDGTPELARLRAGLLARAVDLGAPAAEQAAALRLLVAAVRERPVLAGELAGVLYEQHCRGPRVGSPDGTLDVLAALNGGGLAEGLFAVALTSALGRRHQWPERCRTAVLGLRRHPEPEVRDAAYAVRIGGA
ncbi:hypothetical protein [Streptomyces sp. NPDC047014]|uniref:hypothetical protein n=1 Tax=Streptomyces sp. NPDC047014 TaxID=3155736 RepID=UPI0033F4B60B